MISKTLGRYRIIDEIGHGGMGTVYRAIHVTKGYQVALKVLPPQLSQDATFVRRFQREAQAVKRMNHPGIIKIYETGQANGFSFIAMEYIDGGSLQDRLMRGKPLDLSATVNIIGQIASALDYAHRRGIVHRDIKPSNILLTRDGRAILTDFGIARAMGLSSITKSGAIIGTPEYVSPEQAKGVGVDYRADIYSLGVVCYQMLTGRVPFLRENIYATLLAHINEIPPPLRWLNPRLTPEVERVVMRALAKAPDNRYASAGEFARALMAAARRKAVSMPARVQLRKMGTLVKSPALAWAAILGLLVFTLVVVALAIGGEDDTPPTPPKPYPITGRIAFESDRDGNREIYIVDADGRNLRRLTYNPATDWSPAWSPDGRRIAFVSERDGNMEIYVMDADGRNQIRLTHDSAWDSGPCWSPHGGRIAFDSERDGDSEIYVMGRDGSNPIKLTNNSAFDGDPNWSPDGWRIAFESERDGNLEIYIMDSDGSNQVRLTHNNWRDFGPVFSPDGSKIAFECQREGGSEICVMEADGSDLTRLTINSVEDRQPSWSPDGTKIIFARQRSPGGIFDIYIMDSDGSNQRKLVYSLSSDMAPAWGR
jgi:dipeptidyl aminopeptidase/acylaminoacyl peptidase/predicted Ser/Thr protein kinase